MLKRFFDLLFSLLGLIMLLPLLAVISIIIKLDSPGPVFFRQIRVGRYGEPFKIFKFRTMVNNAEALGKSITIGVDNRITRSGHFLRKWKLDELPQLLNVVRGEMSLVGPRPEVPYYVAMYDDEQCAVLDIIPGITDPASIRYRNESELLAAYDQPETVYISEIIPEKIRINLKYAVKANVWRDFILIFVTLFGTFYPQSLNRRKPGE